MDRLELASILDALVKSEDLAPRSFCKKCGSDESFHNKGGHKFVEDYLTTFCNVGVYRIASQFDYPYFKGLLANEIISQIKKDPRWTAVMPKEAAKMAWGGHLVIAAKTGKPHGHVACVYPAGTVYSAKWGGECPVVANIGMKNEIGGANFYFVEEPAYWLLAESDAAA